MSDATTRLPSETLDRLAARLADHHAKLEREPRQRPELDALVEAAGLLDQFDPELVEPVASRERAGTIDALLASSVPLVDPDGGPQRWALTADTRVAALRQLRERGRIDEAIAANRRYDGALRRALEGQIRRTARPLDEQSLTDLAASFPASEWLRSAGYRGLPAHDEFIRRIDWLTLLAPFEHLAGGHFHGRARELERLRAHAGVLPPGSLVASAQRAVRRGRASREHKPLVVHGPGGVGKSTLIARFILEHAKALEDDRFPFAYLDLDRSAVDGAAPLTLLVEALRQFGVEYPIAKRRFERIAAGWSALIADGDRSAARWASAARDFADAVGSLMSRERPVVLVLDTFEEVQVRSAEDVAAIWALFEALASVVPQLRVIVVGRAEVPGHPQHVLALNRLDDDDAIGFLVARGVTDRRLAQRIVRQVGGSPMSLKLAADLVEQHALPGAQLDVRSRESLLVRIDDRVIQRQLYRRVLDHIHDANVRRLAHPGLVLRRLTPELIRDVLAEPCGLEIESLAEARELFDGLRREVSIVTVGSDGALVHRPDLRLLILEALERDAPDRSRRIRELAVEFYERREPDPRERAEEIYHRIVLGHEAAVVDARWMPGVERRLKTALTELSGRRRAFLAARLGVEVDEETRRLADVEDWEEIVARKVRGLLSAGRTDEALALIATRDERSARSPLVGLHADALARSGRVGDAVAGLGAGIEIALAASERRQGLRLALQQAELVLAWRRRADVEQAIERLDLLTEASTDAGDRLDALTHIIALDELFETGGEPAAASRRGELRERFDSAADSTLASRPLRTSWIVSCLHGGEDARRMVRALSLARPTRHDGAARELAHIIASIDAQASIEEGAEPGLLARTQGVPLSGSLTASWGEFILSEPARTVSEVLCSLLISQPPDRRALLVDAIARVVRSALEHDFGEVRDEPVAQPTAHRPSLSGRTRSGLERALRAKFSSSRTLREFLRSRLDLNLDAITPEQDDPEAAASDVVAYAETRGYLEPLVARALEADPGSHGFVTAAEAIGVSTIVPSDAGTLLQSDAAADELRERLGAIEAQVCRVEAGRALGTGFLVGPDLVLTADLVVGAGDRRQDLVVRFDTRTGHDGAVITPGSVFRVDEIVARREFSEPAEALGYALLRIREAPGALLIGQRTGTAGQLRRWMELSGPFPRLRVGTSLSIVHRPLAEGSLTLTKGEGAVRGFSADGTRVYHALQTVAGSAGSPLLTADLDPVAFHVGLPPADPAAPHGSGVAVLLEAVLDDLRERGLGHLLGAVFS
jgi:hypothetical protein